MSPLTGRSVVIQLDRGLVLFLAKLGLLLLALLLLLRVLSYGGIVLTPLVLSILLAILLNPLVVALERGGFSRTAAAAVVLTMLVLLLSLLFVLLAPVIARETRDLTALLQKETPATLVEKLRATLQHYLPWLKHPGLTNQILGRAEKFFYALFHQSIRYLPKVIPVAIALVLIPFMTFFLLKDGRRLKQSIVRYVPNRFFEMSASLVHKIDCQLGSYIRGQVLVSLCIGTLAAVALAVLRVPNFLLIGAAAGLANMIPYFGPIVGAVPALILNVVDKGSLRAAVPVVAAFLLIRLIDDTLVSPNILGHSLKIHPLLVIMAIFIGSEMYGVIGLLLCIPAVGIAKVVIEEVLWNFRHYRCLRGDT